MEDQGDIAAFRWNAFQLQGSRRRQEDAFIVRACGQTNLVVAVADGLGGHDHGDLASQTAVTTLADQLLKSLGKSADKKARNPKVIEQAIAACDVAVRAIPRGFAWNAPATTLVAAHLETSGHVIVGGVGDSSIWHRSSGGLNPLLERQGRGHVVDYALGFDLDDGRAIQTVKIKMEPGDRLILATDGIETVHLGWLKALFAQQPDLAFELLLLLLREAADPNQDNVTVLMVDFMGSEST